MGAQEELFAGLNCQPGFVCTRSELSQDLRALLQSGKYALEFTFSENLWQPIKSVRVCSLAPEFLHSMLACFPMDWQSHLLQPLRALICEQLRPFVAGRQWT